ncbi:protein-s-isoprenylcysteine O-methyltransferase [Schizopora paradoxa]|uniref:Protein-S-isoprenylcysteine O-methyltransferase n=1 Tax=Schizopora paradoxa TaxID=27342 RepID=A0A0H2S8V2_9AGAM|nr:protein-s-isoprenylcysteine O-methyltransferase [Schizopora paradoxa]
MASTNDDPDVPERFDARLAQRAKAKDSRPQNPLEMNDVNPGQHYGGKLPNTPLAVSTISFLLGGVCLLGFSLFVTGGSHDHWWTTWQLGFFVQSWAFFHWAEFAVTAGWNRGRCNVDSFLLDNGMLYHIANGAALSEYLISLYLKPEWKTFKYMSSAGVIIVLLSQALRSSAMIQASTNFSHAIAWHKTDSHQLVTTGVYRWFRHPSYAGFFYWAVGTQVVLQNPISFTLYIIICWRFFSRRIKVEETALVRFFGDDYKEYRRKVGTKIPFIP